MGPYQRAERVPGSQTLPDLHLRLPRPHELREPRKQTYLYRCHEDKCSAPRFRAEDAVATMLSAMAIVYIGLGANIGNREANLRMAIGAMTRLARIVDVSSLYETDPIGSGGGPDYYNAVAEVETGLEPIPLLRFLKGIEEEIGRRPAPSDAPRPADLDILLYDDLVLEEADLTIPHPRMYERAFVLIPLSELAPDAVHPVVSRTITELAQEGGDAGVRKLADKGWDGYAGKPQDRVRI
jgi:2-amino-4-hydroxy-6-hydroxymethyldihydropteridine diphosphokinase